jgi:hypothetical protein
MSYQVPPSIVTPAWDEVDERVQNEVELSGRIPKEPLWIPEDGDSFVETMPWKNYESIYKPKPLARRVGSDPCIYAIICTTCMVIKTGVLLDGVLSKEIKTCTHSHVNILGCNEGGYQMLWRMDGFATSDQASTIFDTLSSQARDTVKKSFRAANEVLTSHMISFGDEFRNLSIIVCEELQDLKSDCADRKISALVQLEARLIFDDTTFDVIFSNNCDPDIMVCASTESKEQQVERQEKRVQRLMLKRKRLDAELLILNPHLFKHRKKFQDIEADRKARISSEDVTDMPEGFPDTWECHRMTYTTYKGGTQSGLMYNLGPYDLTAIEDPMAYHKEQQDILYTYLFANGLPKPWYPDVAMFDSITEEGLIKNFTGMHEKEAQQWDIFWAKQQHLSALAEDHLVDAVTILPE